MSETKSQNHQHLSGGGNENIFIIIKVQREC